MKKDNKDNSTAGFFALLLFVIAALMVYLAKSGDFAVLNDFAENSAPIKSNSAEAEKRVNKYLQQTSEDIERKQVRRKFENDFSTLQAGQLIPFPNSEKNKPLAVDAPEDQTQKNLKEKMARDFTVDYVTPRSEIEMELDDKQKQSEYQNEYRQKYIANFIENARQHGYKVEVDKNGIVRRVGPIDGDQQNLFEPTAEGPSQ